MLKRTLSLAAAATLLAACGGNPTGPTGPTTRDLRPSLDAGGIPNAASCNGQITSLVARGEVLPVRGIGNVARAAGLSVQEVHEAVKEVCAGP